MKVQERLNIYNCKECGHTITTIDRDKGVTPFLLICPNCTKGSMVSCMYRVPAVLVPNYEWVKGEDPEVLDLRKIEY